MTEISSLIERYESVPGWAQKIWEESEQGKMTHGEALAIMIVPYVPVYESTKSLVISATDRDHTLPQPRKLSTQDLPATGSDSS